MLIPYYIVFFFSFLNVLREKRWFDRAKFTTFAKYRWSDVKWGGLMRLTMRCCKKQMKGADNRRLKNKIHSPTDFTDYTNLFEAKKNCVICEICGTFYAYRDLTYGTPSWNEDLSVA